jgi:peptide deformylase
MAVRPVLVDPDPRLREACRPVEAFDAALDALVADLLDTMYAAPAIGLSAPQLGVALRVVVLDVSPGHDTPEVFVNPEVLDQGTLAIVEESCLSVPGVVAKVRRNIRARVRACDRRGEPFEAELADLRAVCLLHEVDHLEGRLFTDRLPGWRRWLLRLRGHAPSRRAA